MMNMKNNNKKNEVTVPLNIIRDAIEMADNEWNQYLDIEKMEIVSLPEYPFMGEYDKEDQELYDMIEEGWHTRFFGLPSKIDIHEYRIMESFIYHLPEGRTQDVLEGAIRGKGAFRRFKDTLRRFGIEQQWYDFQEAAYEEKAIEWCENYGFKYSGGKVKASVKADEETSNQYDADNLKWEEIRTEHIVQDEWIDFRRSAYRFPDGSVFEPYYSYSRKDYVVIVASDEEGNYLCVRQFRQGVKEVTTEFPAGGIERTDGREYSIKNDSQAAEDALKAAKRELLEETGYVSEEWKHLITVPSNATLADNHAYVFSADNCRRVTEQNLDETEFLNVRKYTAVELETMIQRGDFQQAVHVMAWLLARRR